VEVVVMGGGGFFLGGGGGRTDRPLVAESPIFLHDNFWSHEHRSARP
jgi:hypothetical protein